ncbi:unnamed protein product [Polarella glacialis]|uniref:Uncharacterized protein n=1 Tax=Polarella glacialis TaxID=89957 RepID=A0A813HS24_POLGL|nr:unnamed protein product [Polarella glacialis]
MDVANLAPLRPMQRRGARLGGLLGAAALLSLAASFGAVSFALTGGGASSAGSSPFGATPSSLEFAVTRRASPYYSNEDRERLASARADKRTALREKQSHAPAGVDFDKLPALEDIYNRKYSGNAEEDPIGGRKRYTYYILFKNDQKLKAERMKEIVFEYMWFLKYKMSCKDITVKARKSPIDGQAITSLEYPMKEYGEVPREKQRKDKYSKARMVEFQFVAPIQAGEYIQKRLYADNDVVRFMVLGHTRHFKHVGEDNELLL